MQIENTLLVDGKIQATEAIESVVTVIPVSVGLTDLPETFIDWSKSNSYLLDMTQMDLSGGNDTANIVFVSGNTNNIKNRLVIKQPSAHTPNHVVLTFQAFATVAKIIPHTVLNAANLSTEVNVSGRTTVLEFDYTGTEYRNMSSSYTENTTYASNSVIVDGETYNQSLVKVDEVLEKLAPAPPLLTDTPNLSQTWDATTPLQTGWKSLADGSTITNMSFVDPIMYVKSFKTSTVGNTSLTVDAVARGTHVNNTFIAPFPSTATDQAFTLSRVQYNAVHTAFETIINLTGANAVVPQGPEYDFDIASDALANTFKFRRHVQPTQLTSPVLNAFSCDTIPSTDYVCGIPVVVAGKNLKPTITYNNISYVNSADGSYGSTVGKLTGTTINETLVSSDTAANMLASAPNSPATQSSLTVLTNKFEANATLTAYNYISELGVNGANATLSNVTNPIIVDSITDRSKFGIDHTLPLTDPTNINKPLVLGGLVQYPSTDYSNTWNGVSPQGGLDYSTINNDRFIELQAVLTGHSRIRLDFSEQSGFSGTAIEGSTAYSIEITRADKPTETYNGNAAYSGVGVVANGGSALDVAASTESIKMLTLGEVATTTVTVRIILKAGSTHKFSQSVSLTPLQ